MMTRTPRRISDRPAVTLRRMSSFSRAVVARLVRTSPSWSPRRRVEITSAPITRSPVSGSSRVAANCNRARSIGIRARSCPTSWVSAGRSSGGALRTDAGIACSSEACPDITSRSDSVHTTSASRRAVCSCSAR